jgi:preprotein translocase subunit SecA
MNQQREIVYRYRDEVLEGRDMGPVARDAIGDVIGRLVDDYTPGDYLEDWDLDGLWAQLDQIYEVDFGPEEIDKEAVDREELKRLLAEDAEKLYDEREEELGGELMRALERYLLLQIIDQRWREHLYDMDYLREGIHLRGFAQIEPIVAYKNEAFTLFSDLMNTIWSDFARMIYHVEVEIEGEAAPAPQQYEPRAVSPGGSSTRSGQVTYTGGVGTAQPSALAEAAGAGGAGYAPDGYPAEIPEEVAPAVQQRRVEAAEQIGRNDPCWCGSGKKFKKCHGA